MLLAPLDASSFMQGARRLQEEDGTGIVKYQQCWSRRCKGTVLLLMSMLIVPFMDAIAKELEMEGHPLLQVVWLRFIMQLACTVPVAVARVGLRNFVSVPRRHLLLGRGCLLLGATFSFFGAIRFIPLADAVAITFIEPCFLLILSRLLLREHVPCDRWVASIVGFSAVMLIVKPSSSAFQPASFLALLCAFFFSAYLFATKYLLQQSDPPPPLVLLAYQSLPGALGLVCVMPFTWLPLSSPPQLIMGLTMGAIGACSHGLLILAFDAAEASFLSPLLYTEIINQVVLGYFFFGDLPDQWSAIGIVIIVAVGIYIARQKETPLESNDGRAAGGGGGSGVGAGGASHSSEIPTVEGSVRVSRTSSTCSGTSARQISVEHPAAGWQDQATRRREAFF